MREAEAGPRDAGPDVDELFDADGLYQLRATLAAHGSEFGADKNQLDSLLIVAGELAANAVRHGGGGGRLRLWRRGAALYCEVSDNGPGFADTTVGHVRPDPTHSGGGRGIWMCRQLTSELRIGSGAEGRGATVLAVIPATG